MIHTTTRQAAVRIMSIKHIHFTLTIDFRLEPHLFSEAAGLAFANGASQWDIWLRSWGVEVTCPELKMLGSTISENACLLVYSKINSSSNSRSNNTIRVTNSQFETAIYICIWKTYSKKINHYCFFTASTMNTLLRLDCTVIVFSLLLAVAISHNQIWSEMRAISRD